VEDAEKNAKSFEEQTYEFARQWQAKFGRRDFLKMAAAAGGAALFGEILAGTPAGTALAAPSFARAAAAGQPKPGGVIKIGRVSDSDSLDPQKSTLLAAHEVMTNIYDPLIYLDPAGKVYPALALSWEFSNGNKTVTFKLRQGVKFHDGSPFNAAAVKYTVDRHIAKETASPTSWMLGDFDKAEVIDDYTVAYHYKQPFVPLWVGLGYSYCAPISQAAVKKFGDQFGRNPVGTGPYKFVSWEPDKGVTLEKNPDHKWASPYFANQGEPYLDGAQYVIIPEDATRISALQSGDIDMIHGSDAVPVDKVKQLNKMEGIKVIEAPMVGVIFNFLNTTRKPLDDVRVRQAINYAIDKDKLIALALDGGATPAYGPVASSYAAVYDTDLKSKFGYAYSVEKAKALLKEAGQEAGFKITYVCSDGAIWKRIAEILKEDLAKVNIDMTIAALPTGEQFAKAKDGSAEMYESWYTYGEPDIVYQFLHSQQAFWWDRHVNPELDKLIEDQRTEFDPEKRKQIFWKIQEIVAEQAYWVPMYEGKYFAAIKSYVNGVTIDHLGFHHLCDMWMDK
jgi:peptide/nickel transport system substrate-binding protein